MLNRIAWNSGMLSGNLINILITWRSNMKVELILLDVGISVLLIDFKGE